MALGLKQLNNPNEAVCIETHPDFKPEARHVVDLLLKNPGHYAYFFFHSGEWAQKYVRAESTYEWNEDEPEIKWPMFIWDEEERVDTLDPDATWYDGIYSFQNQDDYSDFFKEFENGNAEYVMETAAGKWSLRRGQNMSKLGEEVNCGAGQFNIGPAEVLTRGQIKIIDSHQWELLLRELTEPFDQSKLSLTLAPVESRILWVPLSFPGAFTLSAKDLMAKMPNDVPEVNLWFSSTNEPDQPVYIKDFDKHQLQELLDRLVDSAGPSPVWFKRRTTKSFIKLKKQIQESIISGKLLDNLAEGGMKIAFIPFSGRSFCVSNPR